MRGFIGVIVSVVSSAMTLSICVAANSFDLGPVDYFNKRSKVIENSIKKSPQLLDWREDFINEQGDLAVHQPPGPVLTLLNDPTEENARAYLNWQHQKMERIMYVQKLLDKLSAAK